MSNETPRPAVAGPLEPTVRPADLQSEALLHAGKCRSWAAKTFNDAPDAALCVGAGDRLLYAAQLLDAQAHEIERLRSALRRITHCTGATPSLSESGCGRLLAQIEHAAMNALEA